MVQDLWKWVYGPIPISDACSNIVVKLSILRQFESFRTVLMFIACCLFQFMLMGVAVCAVIPLNHTFQHLLPQVIWSHCLLRQSYFVHKLAIEIDLEKFIVHDDCRQLWNFIHCRRHIHFHHVSVSQKLLFIQWC